MGLVLVLAVAVGARPVEAAWSDSEVATATVASATLAPPVKGACTGGLLAFTVRWTPPASGPAPDGYRLTVTFGGSPTTVRDVELGPSARNWSSLTLLSTLLVGSYDIYLTAELGNWRSAPIKWTATVVVLGAIVVC